MNKLFINQYMSFDKAYICVKTDYIWRAKPWQPKEEAKFGNHDIDP